jgi:hypothetical protein
MMCATDMPQLHLALPRRLLQRKDRLRRGTAKGQELGALVGPACQRLPAQPSQLGLGCWAELVGLLGPARRGVRVELSQEFACTVA